MPTSFEKSEDVTLITTPNRVLEVVAQFTHYQWKVYVTIIELFESQSKKSFKGGQLAIQSFLKQQTIVLSIPLRKISKPSEYPEVRKSLVAMSKTECEIPYLKNGEERIVTGTIFTLDMPTALNSRSNVKIYIHPEVAKLFLAFPRNQKNEAIFYSTFSPDVVRKLTKVHAIKLYFFLCLWRNRGVVYKSVDDLYHILNLGSKYPRFSDFNKHIIKPAYKALFANGDVWFNIKDPYFYKKEGAKTVGLNFKLLSKRNQDIQLEGVKNMLRNAFKFKDSDFNKIEDVFARMNIQNINLKVVELADKINYDPKINSPKEYIIQSLNNELHKYD